MIFLMMNSVDRFHRDLVISAIYNRILMVQAWRSRCLVALSAGALIKRVGGESTVFKMKIDIFRKLLTFLPLN